MPNELIKARQTIESLSRQLAERDEEYLALAAHLERVEDAALFLIDSLRGSDPIAASDDTPEGVRRVDQALSDKSYRSLDLRDARMKAEALHDLLMHPRETTLRAKALEMRDEYRRRAEGES